MGQACDSVFCQLRPVGPRTLQSLHADNIPCKATATPALAGTPCAGPGTTIQSGALRSNRIHFWTGERTYSISRETLDGDEQMTQIGGWEYLSQPPWFRDKQNLGFSTLA